MTPRLGRLFPPVVLGLLWGLSTLAGANDEGESTPLPDPLTLEYALSLADAPHPDLTRAAAQLAVARADREDADAITGVHSFLHGRLRWVGPSPVAVDQSPDDHSISLLVRKRLADFGRSSALQEAAASEVRGRELLYVDARQARRLSIMARFFDVLLADLEFARDNEAMATAYVELDRARSRHELQQVSDITLKEQESVYEDARVRRYQTEARRQVARAALAQALNRPREIPANLAEPSLAEPPSDLPELADLLAAARANNSVLQATRAQVAAAAQRVKAARARYRPTLDAEVEAAAYARELGSYDRWRAGVVLEVPIYDGGAVQAAVRRVRAEWEDLQAKLEQQQREVELAVMETHLELRTLQAQRQAALAYGSYRDLAQDRARTEYELEFRADLGDAMVEVSEARLRSARVAYGAALAWARLNMLTGQALAPPPGGPPVSVPQ